MSLHEIQYIYQDISPGESISLILAYLQTFLIFCVFDNFFIFQKNWAFGYSWSTLLWYQCYYPHRSRDALSPVCGIFKYVTKNLLFSSYFANVITSSIVSFIRLFLSQMIKHINQQLSFTFGIEILNPNFSIKAPFGWSQHWEGMLPIGGQRLVTFLQQ